MRTALDAALASLAAQQHGTFSRRQASLTGFSPKMIRQRIAPGLWLQLAYDVFAVAGSADSSQRRLFAALLEGGNRSVLSHATAASILGLPGFDSRALHVTRHETRRH